MPFFSSGIKFRMLHYVYHHICLFSSALWQFLSLPLFSRPWQLWRLLFSYLVKCPLIWVCLSFFSWLDWDYIFWGHISQKWGTFLVISYQGVHVINMTYPCWSWTCIWQFLHHKLTASSSPLYILFFGNKSLNPVHSCSRAEMVCVCRGGALRTISWRYRYLHKLLGIIL